MTSPPHVATSFAPTMVSSVVVAAFDKNIRTRSDDHFQGRGLVEDDHRIDRSQRSQHPGAFALADDGPARPLQSAYGCIAVDGDDKPVTKPASLLEQRDVADVQQIETSIGENNALVIGLPKRHAVRKFLVSEHAVFAMQGNLRAQSSEQFMLLYRHGADLANNNAGGDIGQLNCRLGLQTGRQAKRQHRDHGVACAGDVENLARLLQVQRSGCRDVPGQCPFR